MLPTCYRAQTDFQHFSFLSIFSSPYFSMYITVAEWPLMKRNPSPKEKSIGVDCSGNKYESNFKQGQFTEVTVKKRADSFHCKKLFFVTRCMFPIPLLKRQIKMPVLNFWTWSHFTLNSLQNVLHIFCCLLLLLLNTKVDLKTLS